MDFTNTNTSDHAACGVGMLVNIPSEKKTPISSHQLVELGLKNLNDYRYRSGENPVTGESDGAGIKLFGLPVQFFEQEIQSNHFIDANGLPLDPHFKLTENCFSIGQYFLSTDPKKENDAKTLIKATVEKNGLTLVGWRNVNLATNKEILSAKSREKMPAIWQAILVQDETSTNNAFDLEKITRESALSIIYQAKQNSITLNIVSQSSEAIIYKGMIPAHEMRAFYNDLQDEKFTATAAIVHGRFATNTDPQWANAQPCPFFWAHNGEFNSAPANALEMRDQLNALHFNGVFSDKNLSDSMQFDADSTNLMSIKNISLIETLVRLIPPSLSTHYSPEINAMLECFGLERSPYNGPAFAVSASNGYFIAKVDDVGLRPSRFIILQDEQGNRQFYAGSDDNLDVPDDWTIIRKGHLESGGMIMVTPAGEILETIAILEYVNQLYPQHYFQQLLSETIALLEPVASTESTTPSEIELNRNLVSAGWDLEAVEQVLRPMAIEGLERVGAMGDDTNPLYSTHMPPHLSYFFHQLFAQVSAPPLDSIKERDRFALNTTLGPRIGSVPNAKQIPLKSPVLGINDLQTIERHNQVKSFVLDTSFKLDERNGPITAEETASLMREAITTLLIDAEAAAQNVGIIVLSDRNAGPGRLRIPDMIAVAAVRKHLESHHISRQVSIIADSYQITGPHQSAALLAVGANAVYPRGAYAKINELCADEPFITADNYQHATEKCLLKTMGKMGITHVNNYCNGHFMAPLGLDLSEKDSQSLLEHPTLAKIFGTMYSPLKGYKFEQIAQHSLEQYHQAYSEHNDFMMLPHSGYYMPEKDGVKHGYGPEVINAFTDYMKQESLNLIHFRFDECLRYHGIPDYLSDSIRLGFTPEVGFLDPSKKINGYYPEAYLERFKQSAAFKKMSNVIDTYKNKNPTAIKDLFSIHDSIRVREILGIHEEPSALQSQAEIRSLLFSGSMSQGALTVSDPKTPDRLRAHEVLTQGCNAVGIFSAGGEGGESYNGKRNPLTSSQSKQIASGRFNVDIMTLLHAKEIEIKIVQGAKPGEGGQLPGMKVSIRIAAQRGSLPGIGLISPPPHHDIYSIEDLEQLIHDIKSVNPKVSVCVKLAASVGIGTIAVGVVKAGADTINIASNSGGTAAAQQSSIKHTGLPGEIGLAEVDQALRKTGLRDLVKLRTSGGFKTANDVIIATILGADLFELGTTAMISLGCKMQRTCDKSCEPGVATDGHLFKGEQANVERYFVHLAAAIQDQLRALGVSSLRSLRGRTELLNLIDHNDDLYDFSALLKRDTLSNPVTTEQLDIANAIQQKKLRREYEDTLIDEINSFFKENADGTFKIGSPIRLTTQNRSFGARIAGAFANHLEQHPNARIELQTTGTAGQSYAFALPKGMVITHEGYLHDGCGKSMSNGELVLSMPNVRDDYRADKNTIAGNALLYGATGGKVFINGVTGHRFAIRLSGAQVVVEGTGDLPCEYMTSGTVMILGHVGNGLGTGASAGIIFVYDNENSLRTSDSVRIETSEKMSHYEKALRVMLEEHFSKTNSVKAKEILSSFNLSHFKVIIPKELDSIKTLQGIIDIIKTYQLRNAPMTVGMQVWFEQKTIERCNEFDMASSSEAQNARELLNLFPSIKDDVLSVPVRNQLELIIKSRVPNVIPPQTRCELTNIEDLVPSKPITKRPVGERLKGGLDELILDAIVHLNKYVSEIKHDADGCSGCRAQSCAGGENIDSGCPSGKNINTINLLLKKLGQIDPENALTKMQWKVLREAFEEQIKASPFIAYTGAACPAPCQSACTETIPDHGAPNPKKGNKPEGEYVHIKSIEYYLFQLGRSLGWFDGEKTWASDEITSVFGDVTQKRRTYDAAIKGFKPPFREYPKHNSHKKIIIVGSGPAGMQIAFEALRDGVNVSMYEKSNTPGGLLADGIPSHKFSKQYITENFAQLAKMGLELHLNAEVSYDPKRNEFMVDKKPIAHSNNKNTHVALCVGTGAPIKLPASTTENLSEKDTQKIVQAIDFLKIANDLACDLEQHEKSPAEINELITQRFGLMDPRGKKIAVVGGSDTAQDVIRWIARYFEDETTRGQLSLLARGPEQLKRGLLDGYPAQSLAPTEENRLRKEDIDFIYGDEQHLVVVRKITEENGQLKLQIEKSKFKYQEQIRAISEAQALFDKLPRQQRLTEFEETTEQKYDMIICALGFQEAPLPIIDAIKKANLNDVVSIAGDASRAKPLIIVGAQESARATWHNRIKHILNITLPSIFSRIGFYKQPLSEVSATELTLPHSSPLTQGGERISSAETMTVPEVSEHDPSRPSEKIACIIN